MNTRPPKTYPVTLTDLETLADTLADLDAYAPAESKARISQAYAIIERSAGHDAKLIFGEAKEAA